MPAPKTPQKDAYALILEAIDVGLYRPGDRLNLEVDHQTMVMVDTIEQTMGALLPRLLAEHLSKD